MFLVLSLLYQSTPLTNCQVVLSTIGGLYGLGQALVAGILNARTVAVWNGDRYIKAVATFTFLALFAWAWVVPFGLEGATLPGSKFCTNTGAKPWLVVSNAMMITNDFLMLVLFLYK